MGRILVIGGGVHAFEGFSNTFIEVWREISARCRKFAEEHFNSEVNVRRLEKELLKLQK
jgi:hypothetical protein